MGEKIALIIIKARIDDGCQQSKKNEEDLACFVWEASSNF
jgi:hypothetical protein